MNYQFHEVANLFPMMDEQSFSELCRDIKKNGLIEPIWLHDGQIIDGRNRYKACLQESVEPKFREWGGEGSLVEFVVSLNLSRRHLNQSQKAAIALDILPLLEAEAKERMRRGGGDRKSEEYHKSGSTELDYPIKTSVTHKAAKQAADLVGASATRVYEMKRIAREVPEQVEAIRRGEVTVDKVLRQIRKNSEPKKKEVKKLSEEEIHRPRQECTEAMQFAVMAISQLERIREDDPQRVAALTRVKNFINKSLQGE